MATTNETYEAKINLDLQESNAALRDFTSNLDAMFRTVSKSGAELETPFKKSLDSTAKLKGDIDSILDQFKVFGLVGNNAAAALEQIADPIKRAEAATQLLASAMEAATSAEADLATQASVAAAKFEIQTGSTKSLLESVGKLSPAMAEAASSLAGVADATKRAAAAADLFTQSQAPLEGYRAKIAALADDAKIAATKTDLHNHATKSLLESIQKINPKFAESVGHINNIGDAQKRASAASALFAKSQAPVGKIEGAFASLGDKVNVAKAKMAALPPLMQTAIVGAAGAAAGAVLALAAAVGSTLVDAWEAWAVQSRSAQQAQAQLQNAYEQLRVKAGEVIETHLQLTTTMYGAAAAIDVLADATKGLQGGVAEVTGPLSAVAFGLGKVSEGARDQLRWVNPLFNAYERIGGWLEFWGQLEKKRIDGLKEFNETTDIVTSSIERLASSSLQAGTGLEGVEKAMEDTKIEAWKLEQALEALNKKWGEGTFDAQNAGRAVSDMGGGLLADIDKRAKERKKKREDEEKERKKELEQREKDLRAIAKMEWKFNNPLPRSGGAKDIIEKYEGDPGIQKAEKAAADLLEGKAKIEADFKEKRLIKDGEDAKLEESNAQIQNISSSMNDAAKGAVMLGASMAGMALETLVAGDSMKKFGWEALAAFGSFATQAGQVILATGIGELALFEGNPGGAIAAGLGLIAIGSVLGGLAKRNIKKGGSKSSARAETKQIVDSYRNQSKSEDEERNTTIFVQFGTERFQQVVATAVTGGQRTGRLPRYATG